MLRRLLKVVLLGSLIAALAVPTSIGSTEGGNGPTATHCITALQTAEITAKATGAFARLGQPFALVGPEEITYFGLRTSMTSSVKIRLDSLTKKKPRRLRGSQTIAVSESYSGDHVTFGGLWNGRSLKAGNYRATITPIGPKCLAKVSARVRFTLK